MIINLRNINSNADIGISVYNQLKKLLLIYLARI